MRGAGTKTGIYSRRDTWTKTPRCPLLLWSPLRTLSSVFISLGQITLENSLPNALGDIGNGRDAQRVADARPRTVVAGLVIAAMLLEVPGFVAMLYWEVGVYVPPTATGTPAPNTGSLVTVG
jgi:hypothetical protein